MSWGYRVIFITVGFVCFMLFLVFSAFQQTFDLVAEDYYGKELKFQSQIEKQNNQLEMKEHVFCTVYGSMLHIQFPEKIARDTIAGTVLFFRPSDSKKDIVRSLRCSEEGVQEFPVDLFSKGRYRVQIDYTAGGKSYYCEQNIMIP
ncbi:FixH family protein [Cytophaga aurantiaca]|uniref:FixH family protein n=1 Tax=Cytophaga aurantiaca TaxID=29530 RepID=UPI000381047E|nr:FixH family protein [Cytophaga aurantiaca]